MYLEKAIIIFPKTNQYFLFISPSVDTEIWQHTFCLFLGFPFEDLFTLDNTISADHT